MKIGAAICPMCETRPRGRRANGGVDSACTPCTAASRALAKHWAAKGMPLQWDGRRRPYAKSIGRCSVCGQNDIDPGRRGLCEPCYVRVRREAQRMKGRAA